jgi:hypothetical protein
VNTWIYSSEGNQFFRVIKPIDFTNFRDNRGCDFFSDTGIDGVAFSLPGTPL